MLKHKVYSISEVVALKATKATTHIQQTASHARQHQVVGGAVRCEPPLGERGGGVCQMKFRCQSDADCLRLGIKHISGYNLICDKNDGKCKQCRKNVFGISISCKIIDEIYQNAHKILKKSSKLVSRGKAILGKAVISPLKLLKLKSKKLKAISPFKLVKHHRKKFKKYD